MNVEKISIAIVAFCVAATNSRGAHADSFEEYVVDSAAELIPGMLELVVHLRPGSTELTPVTRILLLDGATSTNNRSGIELGNGATVNLGENDYQDALDHIDAGDIVSYLSKPIPSRRPPPRSSIANFNFPIDYPE